MSYSGLLTQTATYWATSSSNAYGEITHSAPVQILVRWQDEIDNFVDDAGEEFISAAIVYTTQELTENSWLYLGTSSETNPQTQNKAYRIRRRMMSQTPSGDIIVLKNILG